ncbi:MAG: choline/carnitine O-acyltransferase [Magnetococcales bacterium]|nr:choline/carnitine O-acyltransferase [Magnetococcales bacterium]
MSYTAPLKNTFQNQALLPELPIPDLKDTCARFLVLTKPLLSNKEQRKTEDIVAKFIAKGGDGEKLQQELIKWSKTTENNNWLEPFMYDNYLEFRGVLPANSNFSVIVEDIPQIEGINQLQCATAVTVAVIKFKNLIKNETLTPENVNDANICMDQVKNLFGSCRIPRQGRDELTTAYPKDNGSPEYAKHILVLYNGHVFSLTVCDELGLALPDWEILQGFEQIIKLGSSPNAKEMQLAVLTAQKRDIWAKAREHVINANNQNRQILENIEKSLCTIVLDNNAPLNYCEKLKVALLGHGQDRWFDKPVQIIVAKNGSLSMNIEHSSVDGITAHRLLNGINSIIAPLQLNPDTAVLPTARPKLKDNRKLLTSQAKRLDFILNAEVRKLIIEADEDYKLFILSKKSHFIKINDIGYTRIKGLKFSPDAFVQLAILATQYSVFKKCRSTYESVLINHFLHGRTQCMRPVTLEAINFAKKMVSSCSNAEKIASLHLAAKRHVEGLKYAKQGLGVDRHLVGIQKIHHYFGKELGINKPLELFSSSGWKALSTDFLTTSGTGELFCGFGPTIKNGIAIDYCLCSNFLAFSIVTDATMEKELMAFIKSFKSNIENMLDLIEQQ